MPRKSSNNGKPAQLWRKDMNKRTDSQIPNFLRKEESNLTFGKQIALRRNYMEMTQEALRIHMMHQTKTRNFIRQVGDY